MERRTASRPSSIPAAASWPVAPLTRSVSGCLDSLQLSSYLDAMSRYSGGPVTHRALTGPSRAAGIRSTKEAWEHEILYTLSCIQEIRSKIDRNGLANGEARPPGWSVVDGHRDSTRRYPSGRRERWREIATPSMPADLSTYPAVASVLVVRESAAPARLYERRSSGSPQRCRTTRRRRASKRRRVSVLDAPACDEVVVHGQQLSDQRQPVTTQPDEPPAQRSGWVGALGDDGNTNRDELSVVEGATAPPAVACLLEELAHVPVATQTTVDVLAPPATPLGSESSLQFALYPFRGRRHASTQSRRRSPSTCRWNRPPRCARCARAASLRPGGA